MLEFVGLFWVIKSQGVEVTRAADLELCLDLATSYPGGNLLDACLCETRRNGVSKRLMLHCMFRRTRRILAGSNLDELLDVTDFLGL